MSDDLLSRVRAIFGEVFDVGPFSILLQTKATDIPEWDSVGHLSLCGALEEAFELRFTVNEMANMTGVHAIVSIIEAKKGTLANGVVEPKVDI